ncbi:MAG: glycosyl hydrolase family 28-related protein [Verrucomicrobia bacterium]|nr:glycosyl hydrolase family 28-related protein [Verrucomicrobiota bacterium]
MKLMKSLDQETNDKLRPPSPIHSIALIVGSLATAVLLAISYPSSQAAEEPSSGSVVVTDAKADGSSDCTAVIQKALDEAAKAGGSVHLAPGRYLVKGSLHIPPGVTLQGVMESPVWSEPLKGSIVLATCGRGQEDGPSLFEMGHSSAVRGLTVWYPEQQTTNIVPYSWTFHLHGNDNTVENVTLINSYNGIRIGPEGNVRHRVRSVYGCVLRRGILVDGCSDIGRIENVQFHCHWWSAPEVGGEWKPVHEFMWKNCEAFIFGRTDWEYVNNTFVFPVNVGYRFIQTKAGAANGQFSGIGADEAQVCVKVEEIQPMGLLISSGQFVCMHGGQRIEVLVEKTCSGSVRLVNCAFWGPARQCVVSHSRSFVSLSDCYLSSTGREKNPGVSLVEADGGKLQVRGCSFGTDEPSIALRKGLRHAIVTENNGVRGVEIQNQIGDQAIVANNEPGGKGP